MADVIVVGSGPTGTMLAGELALAGVDVEVLERRPTADLVGSRAGGIHSRTIEILDQRGIADRFLAAGRIAQTARFGTTVLDIGDFPTRHPYGLALWQDRMEPILAEWVLQLGVPTRRGAEVVGAEQDEEGVMSALADGTTTRARYVVGADGGRSTVRRLAGIAFPGSAATRSTLIAEVEVTEEPPTGDAAGRVRGPRPAAPGRRADLPGRHHGGAARFRGRTDARRSERGARRRLRDRLRGAQPDLDLPVHRRDSAGGGVPTRPDPARRGRGAHPLPGRRTGHRPRHPGRRQPRLEAGQVVHAISPDSLLDTYFTERHPAAARALEHSMAQTVLQRSDDRTAALTGDRRRAHDHGRAPDPHRRAHPRARLAYEPATGTRSSAAGCPISTWRPRPVPRGSSRSSTTPARCC